MEAIVKCPNPNCRTAFKLPSGTMGGRAKCKKCGSTFTLKISPDDTTKLVADLAESKLQRPASVSPAHASQAGASASPQSSAGAPRPAASNAPPLETVGPYVVQRLLGEGAMGRVYLAKDPRLARDVAIKVLPPELAADTERMERFTREARTAARVSHPNTVIIYDTNNQDGLVYLVMEYVDGGSLDDAIDASGPMPWREATRAIRDATAGVKAAHDLGVVHRDIKPANLMRTTKGETKVVDFGLARALQSDTQLTQQGMLMGTPLYMAPELWMGQEANPQSDIYALVCSYYHLLTGRPPFDASTFPALGYQHRFEPLPDPRLKTPGLPDEVLQILLRGTAKDPAARYPDAGAMLAELSEVLDAADDELSFGTPQEVLSDEADGEGETVGWAGSWTKLPGKNTLLALAAGSAVLLVVAGMFLFFGRGGSDAKSRAVIVVPASPESTGGSLTDTLTPPASTNTSRSEDPPAVPAETPAPKDSLMAEQAQRALKRRSDLLRIADDRTAGDVETRAGSWQNTANAVIQNDLDEGHALRIFGERSWSQYDLSLEVKHLSVGDECGVCFQVENAGNLRAFYIHAQQGRRDRTKSDQNCQLISYANGNRVDRLRKYAQRPIKLNKPYTLLVLVRGADCHCFLDGEWLLSGRDEQRTSGRIALATSSAPAEFRNILVTRPDGELLWKGLPSPLPARPPEKPAAVPKHAEPPKREEPSAKPEPQSDEPPGDFREVKLPSGNSVTREMAFIDFSEIPKRFFTNAGKQDKFMTGPLFEKRKPYAAVSFKHAGGSFKTPLYELVGPTLILEGDRVPQSLITHDVKRKLEDLSLRIWEKGKLRVFTELGKPVSVEGRMQLQRKVTWLFQDDRPVLAVELPDTKEAAAFLIALRGNRVEVTAEADVNEKQRALLSENRAVLTSLVANYDKTEQELRRRFYDWYKQSLQALNSSGRNLSKANEQLRTDADKQLRSEFFHVSEEPRAKGRR